MRDETFKGTRGRIGLVVQGLLSAPEAEHIIGALQSFGIDQVFPSSPSGLDLLQPASDYAHAGRQSRLEGPTRIHHTTQSAGKVTLVRGLE